MLSDDSAGASNIGSTWPPFHNFHDFNRRERNFDVCPAAEDMHMRRLVVARDYANLKTTISHDGRHAFIVNLTALDYKGELPSGSDHRC